MGSLVSRVEDKLRSGALDGKLADIKQAKRLKDAEVAMRIAATRDRLCWLGSYYGFVLCIAIARHISMHRRGVHLHFDNFFMPLGIPITFIPPVLFMYQVDLAMPPCVVGGVSLFGKGNRIADEAQRIRDGSVHRWFDCAFLPQGSMSDHEVDDGKLFIHRPICLPLVFEASYLRERAAASEARALRGLPAKEEPPWAYFRERCLVAPEARGALPE